MDRSPGRRRRIGGASEVDSSYESTEETQEDSSDVTVEEVVEAASPGPERDDAVGDMCESDNVLRQELDELLKWSWEIEATVPEGTVEYLARRCVDEEQAAMVLAEMPFMASGNLASFLRKLNASGTLNLGAAPVGLAVGSASNARKSQPGSCLLPLNLNAAKVEFQRMLKDAKVKRPLVVLSLCMSEVLSMNVLYCVGWSQTPINLVHPAELTRAQVEVCKRVLGNAVRLHWTEGAPYNVDEQIKDLDAKVCGYGGDVVSVRRQLVADKVIPAWPKPEESCVAAIIEFMPEEIRDDLSDPSRCLLPKDQWPVARPRSKVHATNAEWYSICKAAAARNLFGTIALEDVFTDQFGEPVLNGAMGVDKF